MAKLVGVGFVSGALLIPALAGPAIFNAYWDGGAIGTWVERGMQCSPEGLPQKGTVARFAIQHSNGRFYLTHQTDEYADGKAIGAESEFCQIDITGRDGAVFTGEAQCRIEESERSTKPVRIQRGQNEGEAAPFLALRLGKKLYRYTQCVPG